MLQFDPQNRITAAEGLVSQYLAPYHDPNDEPVADEKFEWSFLDTGLPIEVWKNIMYVTELCIYGNDADSLRT